MCNLSAGIREEVINSIKNIIRIHFEYQIVKDLCIQKVTELYPSVNSEVIKNMVDQFYG
ncbi:MAG: hypothetical protein KBT48_08250 [Firmicutes bacterium]|nr:hypothetical protein [Bacillota bacterium]